MSGIDVGILSLGARGDAAAAYEGAVREEALTTVIRQGGFEVVGGGASFPEEDRVATRAGLLREQVHVLCDLGADVFVIHPCAGARGADAAEAARLVRRLRGAAPRIVVFGDAGAATSREPDLLAVRGGLWRAGFPHRVLRGDPADATSVFALVSLLGHLAARVGSREGVARAVARLARDRVLCLGPAGSRRTGEGLDTDTLARTLGTGVVSMRRDVLDARCAVLIGEDISPDTRLRALLEAGVGDPGELASWLALTDLAREEEAGAVVLCEECGEAPVPARALAWLADVQGPDGRAKDALACAPAGDLPAALAARALNLLAAGPAGVARITGGEDGAWELDTAACPGGAGLAPGAPVTLARFSLGAGRCALFAFEAEVRAQEGGRLRLGIPPAARRLASAWPATTAALVAGNHVAALEELAATLCQAGHLAPAGTSLLEIPGPIPA